MAEPKRNPPTKDSPYCLLVEGSSDQHSIIHLMKRHGYNWDSPNHNRPFVLSYGGIPKLPKAITAQKTKPRLGIVVDADERPEQRWREVTNWLQPVVTRLPDQPSPGGLILDGLEPGSKVGIWLMPDNRSQGALEDLVCELVPSGDACWDYAGEQAQEAKRRYGRDKLSFGYDLKSRLHTWLAWQEEPGQSFGQALKKEKLMRHDTPTALAFADWFRRLFPEQAA